MIEPGHRTASAVIVGDEVLTGKTQDTNSFWLARELYALGVSLEFVAVIPDRVEEIARVVADCSQRFDLVFTSGGVGPTHDDMTYAGVARAFGIEVVTEPRLVERMQQHYRGELNAARLRMAQVPLPDELCFNEHMLTPVVRVRNVYILPGIPELFRQLVGGLRERFRSGTMYLGEIFTQQAEGDFASLLEQVVADHPRVRVGSYPRLGDGPYRVKLVVESKDRPQAEAATAAITAGLDRVKMVEIRPVDRVVSPEVEGGTPGCRGGSAGSDSGGDVE